MKLTLPRCQLWYQLYEPETISRCLLETHRSSVVRNGSARRWKSKSKSKGSISNYPDGTFTAREMELRMLADEKLQKKPEDWTKCMWKVFTDYMFSVRWDINKGWGIPTIGPIANFKIHPASKCLQYGIEVFEGLKAYRGSDGFIRLFRPELNMARLLDGARRMHLPTFCGEEFTTCIKKLVLLEEAWIPKDEGSSLYIRPSFVGTEACLDFMPARSALLYVVLCPVPDVPTKPISVYADTEHVKSWPGGFGDVKIGGNYGPMIHLQSLAEKHGCQQIMWLQGEEENITDLGNMNIFFVLKNKDGGLEMVTPPLNGVLLNGVVRQSILELCKEWKKFGIIQRSITMVELRSLLEENRVREIFGTGTSNIICPVTSVVYKGSKLTIPTLKPERPIHAKIKQVLTEIYYGRIDHKWTVRVDE